MARIKRHGRQYDLVLFGATGYTGKWTVEYIANNLSVRLKWAVAGRSESKLQAVVEECKRLYPNRIPPAYEVCELNDEDLATLAQKTYVLLTTVGPYCLYGEHAFKACAENGTHYVDATGEIPWTHHMIKKYEKVAKESGAMLFPQAAIESACADLSTWALAKRIRTDLGVPTKDVTISLHRISSAPSGGTLASFFNVFDVYTFKEVMASFKPYAQSPIRHPEPARRSEPLSQKIFGTRFVRNLGILTTSAFGAADIATVERTWGLLSETPSRKGEFYGPNFTWTEGYKVRNWLQGVLFHWFFGIAVGFIAFMPFVRTYLKRRVTQPGDGVSREVMEREEIEFRGIAQPDSVNADNKVALSRAVHRGGLYYLTALLLTEAAATILQDDLKLEGGIYTPAFLGQGMIDRCYKGGFKIDTQIIDY